MAIWALEKHSDRAQIDRKGRTGGDLRITLKLTLNKTIRAITKVRIKKQIRNNSEPVVCSKCGGSGEVRMVQKSLADKIVNVQPCQSCNGMQGLVV